MSLFKYPKYKECGTAWDQTVPEHWLVLALARVLKIPVTDGPHITPTFHDEGVPFLSVDGIQDGELVFEGCRFVSHDDHREFSRKASPRRNDILMGKAASIGKIARVRTDMQFSIWSPLALIRVSEEACHPTFAEYALKSPWVQAQVETLANSNTQLNIGMKDIPKLRFALPPPSEQRAIAAFLDCETAKIDALIAEQEKLLALLVEKRQATISLAVTRGLDSDAPLKDSGIPWLGQVPAHWSCPPLYMRYSSELGKMLDASRITGRHLVPYLRNVDVQWDAINYTELPSMDIEPGEYARYTVRDGDLLVCEGGEVGRAAVVQISGDVIGYQKALHRLRALTDECPRYMFYTFAWASKAGAFSGEGQSTIAHLTGEQLRKYRFPRPSRAEQESIAAFLDDELVKLSKLRAEVEGAIGLLKERRSALIAAAVTGQIDVRGLAELTQ